MRSVSPRARTPIIERRTASKVAKVERKGDIMSPNAMCMHITFRTKVSGRKMKIVRFEMSSEGGASDSSSRSASSSSIFNSSAFVGA